MTTAAKRAETIRAPTITKARYGSRTVSTETRLGSSLASVSVVRHAPACVVAAADYKISTLEKCKVARASPIKRRNIDDAARIRGDREAIVAPVTLAISSSVRPARLS